MNKADIILTEMDKFQLLIGDRQLKRLGSSQKFWDVMEYVNNAEKRSDVERAEGLEAFRKGVELDYTVPNPDRLLGLMLPPPHASES